MTLQEVEIGQKIYNTITGTRAKVCAVEERILPSSKGVSARTLAVAIETIPLEGSTMGYIERPRRAYILDLRNWEPFVNKDCAIHSLKSIVLFRSIMYECIECQQGFTEQQLKRKECRYVYASPLEIEEAQEKEKASN